MKKIFILTVCILLICISGYLIIKSRSYNRVSEVINTSDTKIFEKELAEKEFSSDYFYPLTKYTERITIRNFGKKIDASDNKNLPCGSQFTGLHDADDLEVLSEEDTSNVPVYIAAKGKLIRKESVEGYGGLLVQSATINNNPVTIYYGHVDLNSISKKVGDVVYPGEQIAVLGEGCSAETDGEREHLHFAIKKGSNIDVRGYVPSADVLSGWLNPKDTLVSLNASIPK